jgi:hypothetical protein
MPGSAEILVNVADLDSGTDGAGSGSDETSGAGAAVSVPERADIAVTLFLGEASSDPASQAETLVMTIQVSVDGGSTWGTLALFRSIAASELSGTSGTAIDESTGSATFRRAIPCRTPSADSDQAGLVIIRPNSVISDTTNWSVFSDVRDRGSVRDIWYDDAIVA